VIFAGTSAGVSISRDGGQSFVNKTFLDGLGSNSDLGVHGSGSVIYVATNNGNSYSTNGGSTFVNKTTANGLGSNMVQYVFHRVLTFMPRQIMGFRFRLMGHKFYKQNYSAWVGEQ